MRVIFGLGNPGSEYEKTRHNAGFWYIDALAKKYGCRFKKEKKFKAFVAQLNHKNHKVWLVKPDTFMNRSGQSVTPFVNFYRINTEQILLAYDELDLDVGQVKLKKTGGHGGHNGLRDIIPGIGKDFNRLRIGIGHPGHKSMVTPWVLGRPSSLQKDLIDQCIEKIIDVTDELVMDELDKAMNYLHTN